MQPKQLQAENRQQRDWENGSHHNQHHAERLQIVRSVPPDDDCVKTHCLRCHYLYVAAFRLLPLFCRCNNSHSVEIIVTFFQIFTFFGSETEAAERYDRCLSNKLRTTLKRIHDNLILEEDDDVHFSQQGAAPAGPVSTATDDSKRDKVAHPHLSGVVDLNEEKTMYGLAERIVATESL